MSDKRQYDTRSRVVVERYVGHRVVVRETGQFFAHQHGLAATRAADQHDRVFVLHEQIHEVFGPDRFGRVDQRVLRRE